MGQANHITACSQSRMAHSVPLSRFTSSARPAPDEAELSLADHFRLLLPLIILTGLVIGCSTPNAVHDTHTLFSEIPLPPPEAAPQVHSDPQPASESVRQKVVAAYATTYWAQIYPAMRDCWYLPDTGQYAAAFHKNGQSLERFPKKDSRWHLVIATFDAQVQLVSCRPCIY